MAITEVSFTDLLRDPKPVVAAAEKSRVRIRRRDGLDLVLGLADADESVALHTAAIARLLAAFAAEMSEDEISHALLEGLAWTEWLPPRSRSEFAHDLIRAISQAGDLESFVPIQQTMREWKATATIYTDPYLAERLQKPIAKPLGRRVSKP